MVKKIVSAVLIPILLLQFYSCYSMSGISHEELLSQSDKSDIRITTFQAETFEFKSFNYYIKSDTLFGKGEKIMDSHTTIPFSGKIAVSDIEYVAASKYNTTTTCLTWGAGALLLVVIVFYLIFRDFQDNLFSGCNSKQ